MTRKVAGKLDELTDLLRRLPPERVALLLRPSERLTVYLTPVQRDAIRRAADHYDLTISGFAAWVLDAVAALVVESRGVDPKSTATSDGLTLPPVLLDLAHVPGEPPELSLAFHEAATRAGWTAQEAAAVIEKAERGPLGHFVLTLAAKCVPPEEYGEDCPMFDLDDD